jgi:predicted amidohydrolase YtcJ
MPTDADILITHAHVFTADPENPDAQAVGIQGNRIVFVGTDQEASAWRGKSTRMIETDGCTLMPGFIDCHFHLLMGALALADLHADSVSNFEEVEILLKTFASENPDKSWLAGYGLRYNLGPGHTPFNRHHLDAILADRPVIITAYDFHTAWANTAALQRAGIFHGAACGANSEIVLDEHGEATGELREVAAMRKIKDLLPRPDDVSRHQQLLKGIQLASTLGITSVQNMDGDPEQAALYADCEKAHELTVRIKVPYSITPDTPFKSLEKEAALMKRIHQTGLVRSGCVKLFMDGVIEAYTGLLVEDYADKPGWSGASNYEPEHFRSLILEADRLGLQILVHSVGDGGVRRTLDTYEMARRINGRRDHRHRIEHLELIHPQDVPRFSELGVIASMQPLHAPPHGNDGDVWLYRVGEKRWPYSFSWSMLRAAGTHLVYGSDWPVVSPNPLLGVHNALNRLPWKEGLAGQRQTLADTLLSYTSLAAQAEFQEGCKGQLKTGYLADLVLLSNDLFAIQPDQIKNVRPRMTIMDGRIVHEA